MDQKPAWNQSGLWQTNKTVYIYIPERICATMKIALRFILLYLLFNYTTACNSESQTQRELDLTRSQIEALQSELDNCKINNNVKLMHLVFVPVKQPIAPDSLSQLVEMMQSLRSIPEVRYLRVGTFADSKDPRLLKNFSLVLQVGFESMEDLIKYDSNEFHQQIRREAVHYLNASPSTYDFWINSH